MKVQRKLGSTLEYQTPAWVNDFLVVSYVRQEEQKTKYSGILKRLQIFGDRVIGKKLKSTKKTWIGQEKEDKNLTQDKYYLAVKIILQCSP